MTQTARMTKDLQTIFDFLIMQSDWEAQQEWAIEAYNRIRSDYHDTD